MFPGWRRRYPVRIGLLSETLPSLTAHLLCSKEVLDGAKHAETMVLDGCRIYAHGYTDEARRDIRASILNAGGRCIDTVGPSVSVSRYWQFSSFFHGDTSLTRLWCGRRRI